MMDDPNFPFPPWLYVIMVALFCAAVVNAWHQTIRIWRNPERAVTLARIPRVVRSVPSVVTVAVLAVLVAIALSLQFGAGARLAAHLLVYGAEFVLAVAIKAGRVLREPAE